jgi:anti-sigma factor RsiW
MRDCWNVTIRERLPELLHDRLPPDARVEVERHLEVCADCRAELEILRHVRAIGRAPAVDVARIVAALPAYRSVQRARSSRRYAWLAAAAVVLLAGGAAIAVTLGRRDIVAPSAPVAVETPAVAPAPVAQGSTPLRLNDSARNARAVVASAKGNELGVGEGLHDLTDSELRALLADLESLEAVTPTETEVVPPAVERRGS